MLQILLIGHSLVRLVRYSSEADNASKLMTSVFEGTETGKLCFYAVVRQLRALKIKGS